MWAIIQKAISILYEICSYEKGHGKNVLFSKTLWVTGISLLALLLSKYAGLEISQEEQLAILAVVATIMRFISKEEVGLIQR